MSTQEQIIEQLEAQLARVRSGESPSAIFITCGPGGQTFMCGDVAQCYLALGVAQRLLEDDCLRRAAQGSAHGLFNVPTAGSA
jgi:hypothetical protein